MTDVCRDEWHVCAMNRRQRLARLTWHGATEAPPDTNTNTNTEHEHGTREPATCARNPFHVIKMSKPLRHTAARLGARRVLCPCCVLVLDLETADFQHEHTTRAHNTDAAQAWISGQHEHATRARAAREAPHLSFLVLFTPNPGTAHPSTRAGTELSCPCSCYSHPPRHKAPSARAGTGTTRSLC